MQTPYWHDTARACPLTPASGEQPVNAAANRHFDQFATFAPCQAQTDVGFGHAVGYIRLVRFWFAL